MSTFKRHFFSLKKDSSLKETALRRAKKAHRTVRRLGHFCFSKSLRKRFFFFDDRQIARSGAALSFSFLFLVSLVEELKRKKFNLRKPSKKCVCSSGAKEISFSPFPAASAGAKNRFFSLFPQLSLTLTFLKFVCL